jgi:DNA-binding NarL/FixJ family response regulator
MDERGTDAWSANGERSRARVRVFLVDDHVLFRTGLRALLEEHGLETVGDVGDAEQAFGPILRLQPDVVLMDLSLPGLSGVEATRRLTALAPEVQILILTAHTGDQVVVDAVQAGACGYLVKDAPTEDLVRAIEAAARGQASLSPGATTVVLDRLRGSRYAPSTAHAADTDQARASSDRFSRSWSRARKTSRSHTRCQSARRRSSTTSRGSWPS